VLAAGRAAGRVLGRIGIKLGTDATEIARGHASLGDPTTRLAFIHTLRASVDPRGQRVRATDRLYLASALPLLILWGARDQIIPAEHGRRAQELVPDSRLVLFERAGHFPYLDEPERFVATLEGWIASTEPGQPGYERFRAAIEAARGAAQG
jgi:pimeloyl-ACP methyl ester carboxylesterase